MNVLYLSHRIPFPANKGEKIRTFHQIEHLVGQGHRVTVFAPTESRQEREFQRGLERALQVETVTEPLAPAWQRKLHGLTRRQPISVAHFDSPALQQRLDRHLQREPVDVIICTSSTMAAYVFRCTSIRRRREYGQPRLIMDFMDLDSDKWHQYQRSSRWPMSWIYRREAQLLSVEERRVHAEFDACLFISQSEVDLFARQVGGRDKLHVSANGLDTRAFHPPATRPDNRAPVFLFTGVMNYRPNEDAVLWFADNLWPEVLRHWPEARFIVAGMDPSARIRQLARTRGIEVTGYVDDILPYYHGADVFVAPFRLSRGVQNKVLQAFACGVPVVTTGMGAEGIDCQHQQHLYLGDTEKELLEGIVRLVTEPELAQRLATNALALVRDHYSWPGRLAGLAELVHKPSLKVVA